MTRIAATLAAVLAVYISLFCFGSGSKAAQEQEALAATPPMGWNSWDSYAETVSEADIKANADWMAKHLKVYGWEYVVVDEGWYVTNHSVGSQSADAKFSLDTYGRYKPAVNTIPSSENGAGFKPLADYVHSLGLKFGIHIIRGIPREAVRQDLPIAGSRYAAKAAADTTDTCPWNPYNYGVKSTPAGQAYYDSIARLYADWGVDFLKVDCISSHPYKADEIRMIHLALKKTHRPIVLSLSPGPSPVEKGAELKQYAQMWRISDDIWDVWFSDKDFPQGVGNQFARAAKWVAFSGPGHWPDADMLPLGRLEPAAGWGEPRKSRLTHDEQRTLLTLWSIFRSPLIMGGNLTLCDEWTQAVLTNAELIGVDQHSLNSRAVVATDKSAVWLSTPESGDGAYLAVFNLDTAPQSVHYTWKDLGLKNSEYKLRDIWEHKDLGNKDSVDVALAPHASAIYWASEQTSAATLQPANPRHRK